MAHRKPPHAIVFPYPYQGHVTPAISLTIRLASTGFTVTFVQTHFIHHFISTTQNLAAADAVDVFDQARKLGMDIRYETISDGFPLEYDRDFNFDEYWETMFRDFPGRVDEIVAKTIAADTQDSSSVPTAAFLLVADTFYSWPAAIAKKHNMVNVSFWTEPAPVFWLCYNLDLLRKNGHCPCTGNGAADRINYVPGVESISTRDLMTYVQDPDMIPTLMKIVVKAFDQVKEADFVLCNSVEELESECISALNQNQPTYAIGPVNFYADFLKTSIPKSLWLESDCTEWLNSKPCRSVLYVSFGSIAQTTKQEIAELAHGLRLSQAFFVWVLRPGIVGENDAHILPQGWEDAIKDQGLIVPWCNQNAVLSNSATGGFLTHCGWNSVLESIFHHVPMICYPFLVDQPTNRKLVVEDWKVGINLCDGDQVVREEVAAKINKLMKGEESTRMREEVKKVSQKMQDSLRMDGSSNRNFNQFVRDIENKSC